MKRRTLQSNLSMLAIGLLAFSCITNYDEDVNIKEQNTVSEICVKDGYLVFNSLTAFKKTEEKLKNLSTEELNNWEAGFSGFQSQRAIYEIATELDYKFAMEQEALHPNGFPENERAVTQIYADYVLENKHLFEFPEDDAFRLKIEGNHGAIERFVNREGIVQIGDSIFQYVDQKIKVITDGDENKISTLSSIEENGQDNKVMIKDVMKIPANGPDFDQKVAFFGNDNCEGKTSGGGQRVLGRTLINIVKEVDSNNNYGFGYYQTVVTFTAANFRADNQAHSWGAWRGKDTSQLKITGNDIHIYFGGVVRDYISFTITNPSQVKYISWNAFETNQLYLASDVNNTTYIFSGSAKFYGRDGTMCSL